MGVTIKHKDKAGGDLVTLVPENLAFTLNKGENGPHIVTYEVSRSRTAVTPDFVGPYRTAFELWIDDDTLLIAGPHVEPYHIATDEEKVDIAGKDWLHLLNYRFWPFDDSDPLAHRFNPVGAVTDFNPPAGFAYYVAHRDSANIVTDLLDVISGDPNALPLTYSLDPIDHLIPLFSVDYLDQENIYAKIQTLSQEDPGEFDFGVNPDKEFWIVAPRLYDIGVVDDSGLAEHIFDMSVAESSLAAVDFSNNGPAQTRLRGQGQSASTTLADVEEYVPASETYFLKEANATYGDVLNRDRVKALTRKQMLLEVNPQHDIMLQVNPDTITDFWTRFKPGIAIWLTANLDGHEIDSAQEVVSIDGVVDTNDNKFATLKLNQIYAAVEL